MTEEWSCLWETIICSFGRTLIIVMVNSDTTFLSHPLPSYHHLELIHGDLSFRTQNGDYISASTGSNKVRIGLRYKMTQSCQSHHFLKHDVREWGFFESTH